MAGLRSLYHESLYDTALVPSYWEESYGARQDHGTMLEGDAECDVAIIGGGYTGLSAALHLARDFGIDVAVLESGPMGWGASGRNGGFNCLPASKMTTNQMIRKYGLDDTKAFWRAQLDGVDLVEELAQSEGFEIDRQGDGNLEVAHRPGMMAELQEAADQMTRLFGIETRTFSAGAFAEIGYRSTEQFGALHMKAGYALNPLKLALGLAGAAERHGVRLHPHSTVTGWRKDGAWHLLETATGCLRAKRVLMATNGFTREGMHKSFDDRLLPVQSNIITTRALSPEELAAHNWQVEEPICNTRNMLFYFRMLKDRRLLFGARGDWTGRPEDGRKMKAWMIKRLGEVFPHWRDVEISHYWRGLVCMSQKLAPSLGRDEADPSLFYSYGYHANGVNTAPWSGRAMARLIAGQEGADAAIPAVMKGTASRFPFAGLRIWYLRAAASWYRWQDDRQLWPRN
ncbi:NAD(P)/FAD-dependent oxidoreductase [Aestuariispira insulae]|uniref:Glycine/D-amino acid oxidase-like deaminating enzyme n=1 Tax=Aestuariispira insulae TaxID=1461337 RepID=A0A3D9HKC2_9PROT|nr:FAD-binding oxidoreductase [Aestuariispira insulae]RED49962.1 glycine/D-amino acid oxidase-like deaminating enzyme [Aestuariispira insulae]